MAKQAEESAERRAKVIHADGEFQAAKLADRPKSSAKQPMALQTAFSPELG